MKENMKLSAAEITAIEEKLTKAGGAFSLGGIRPEYLLAGEQGGLATMTKENGCSKSPSAVMHAWWMREDDRVEMLLGATFFLS